MAANSNLTTANLGTIKGKVVLADLIVRFFNPSGLQQFSTVQYLPRPEMWAMRTNDTTRNVDGIENAAWVSILLAFLGTILLISMVMCFTFTVRYWNTKLIRGAAGPFLECILIGIAVQGGVLFLPLLTAHPHPVSCQVEKWLSLIGFTMAYGSLFIKTYRVKEAMNYRSKIKLTNKILLLRGLLPLLAIMIVYLMLWTFINPSRVTYHNTHTHCSISYFDWIAIALRTALLALGIYLAIAVRNAPSAFNEAFYICISTYWTFTLLIVGTVMALFLQGQPATIILGTGLEAFLSLLVLLSLIWLPKMAVVAAGKENAVRTSRVDIRPLSGSTIQSSTSEYVDVPSRRGLSSKMSSFIHIVLGAKPSVGQSNPTANLTPKDSATPLKPLDSHSPQNRSPGQSVKIVTSPLPFHSPPKDTKDITTKI